jgi:diadenosine tetraphosphate (Ap4A) HIT family hydrolase
MAYFQEMVLLATAIERAFQPRKLNYELLGNQVPHLHWHLFPRSETDPDRLKPVWLAIDRAERDAELRSHLAVGPSRRAETIERLRAELSRHHPEE